MALSMSRPWKHPKTGVYRLRKGVPLELRALVGKREEKRTLGTRDPHEAKKRHLAALAEVEARWANLRSGPRALTEVEAHALAVPVHDWWLRTHRDDPSQQRFWKTDVGDKIFPPMLDPVLSTIAEMRDHTDLMAFRADIFLLEQWCNERAGEVLAHNGLEVDEASRRKLAKAVGAAVQRASISLTRLANGEAIQQVPWTSSATAIVSAQAGSSTAPVSLDDLVKGWAAETRPAEKTVYEWTRVVGQLATFLDHRDAARISGEDLIAWKDQLVESPAGRIQCAFRCRASHSLGDGQRRKEGALSPFGDRAWAWLYRGWELDEHRDRLRAEQRHADLLHLRRIWNDVIPAPSVPDKAALLVASRGWLKLRVA